MDIQNTVLPLIRELIVEMLKDYSDYSAEAIYLTRPYITKHGMEDFPEEDDSIYFLDAINNFTTFQGNLRYGRLNYDQFVTRCLNDFSVANNNWKISYGLSHAHSMEIKEKNNFNYLSYTKYAEDIMEVKK